MLIRNSKEDDIFVIRDIYSYHILNGTGTFEIDVPSLDEMSLRRADVINKGLPYIVIEEDNKVVGFAYCNQFKPRPAFRYFAEDSIYLNPEYRGKGLGRLLLNELCIMAEQAGIRKLIAIIGDSNNAGSIGVHRSAGFCHVGVVSGCGWKFNQWLDIVMMEKPLGNKQMSPPDK